MRDPNPEPPREAAPKFLIRIDAENRTVVTRAGEGKLLFGWCGVSVLQDEIYWTAELQCCVVCPTVCYRVDFMLSVLTTQKRDTGKLLEVTESQVYTYVQTHQIVYIKYITEHKSMCPTHSEAKQYQTVGVWSRKMFIAGPCKEMGGSCL